LQVSGVTPGRAAAMLPLVIGLASLITGGLSLRYAKRSGSGKRGAIIAQLIALLGIILSILHLVRASGGFGTGSGKLGAIVALVLSIIGIILGRKAQTRSRRNSKGTSDPGFNR
jgi:hypothetical protein